MGLRPTQGNERRLGPASTPLWNRYPYLVIPTGAKRRDLRFRRPFVEMFFDRAYPDFLSRCAGHGHVCGFR
jgi:hypothetical protein